MMMPVIIMFCMRIMSAMMVIVPMRIMMLVIIVVSSRGIFRFAEKVCLIPSCFYEYLKCRIEMNNEYE